MPQAFQYEVIEKAYKECTEFDFEYGTECLHLAQKYAKTRAALIDGPDFLWKVTYKKDLYSVEGVLREQQVHVVAVVGTHCPKFVEKLHEQFDKREVKVTYLADMAEEQQLSQTVAEQVASQINTKLKASTGCVSIVYLSESTRSDERESTKSFNTEDVKWFLRNICQKINSCLIKHTRLVNVSFSSSKKEFNSHKMATEDLQSYIHEQGITCFGVFVSPVLNRTEDNDTISRQLDKAAQLTVGALMDVPSVFSGQTFDANT